jgi:small subunit ribosomal protein S13
MSQRNIITILGAKVDTSKVAEVAFRGIYGVGRKEARRLCGRLGINPHMKLERAQSDLMQISHFIETNYPDRKAVQAVELGAIQKMVEIKTWRGIRHQMALPVNGQRTHSNANTQRKLGPGRLRRAKIQMSPRQLRK